ncbi:MAG: hypothetical protein COA78_28335 [Blastopirellula sp.]|nr:MAG: hypothetical protein COA78_28335 [Blastopirellula sp.]
MDISTFTPIDWVFLISLATIAIGWLGWYVNRSIVELKYRLKPDEGIAKYNRLEAKFLPKRKVSGGRWANKEFHDHVDNKARNGISRLFLLVSAIGIVVHAAAWIYMINFADK